MFCLTYYPHQTYLEDADELKIKYRSSDRTLEDFIKHYQNKTIIIDVSESGFEDIDAKLFKELYNKYHNIKIIFYFSTKDYLSRAKEYNIPFFFKDPVTTIDQLYGFLNYNPTDMYICEELGFFLDKVSKILHEKNVKIRVFPNICQSSFSDTPSLKTFFIRPEDIPIYAQFVDVFELVSDEERQRVIYKVYKEEKWFGKINEIIPSFHGELDSKYVIDSFGVIRSICGKRCLYKPGTCNICDRFTELANTFKENKIIIRSIKKKN